MRTPPVCITQAGSGGAYPTADTARNIFNAGTLYVGVDEDGAIWGSMNLNGVQLPEYKNGGWSIPPRTIRSPSSTP